MSLLFDLSVEAQWHRALSRRFEPNRTEAFGALLHRAFCGFVDTSANSVPLRSIRKPNLRCGSMPMT
jgi:hypothetical protein